MKKIFIRVKILYLKRKKRIILNGMKDLEKLRRNRKEMTQNLNRVLDELRKAREAVKIKKKLSGVF